MFEFSLLAPVASAIMGAIAIRAVEVISERRSGVSAIHHQIVENYWRLEAQIWEIEQGNWSREYTQEIRLDGIDAVKARSPGVYIQLVDEVDDFPPALTSLENIRREQIESRKPDAYVTEDKEDVVERLEMVQEVLADAEEGISEYKESSLIRRVLLLKCLDEPNFESQRIEE